jgi:hypothetical protein
LIKLKKSNMVTRSVGNHSLQYKGAIFESGSWTLLSLMGLKPGKTVVDFHRWAQRRRTEEAALGDDN